MSLEQVLLGRLIQDLNLLLVEQDLLLQHGLLFAVLLALLGSCVPRRGRVVVLLLSQDVLYLFNLLEDENHLGLALADLKCVSRVLLV